MHLGAIFQEDISHRAELACINCQSGCVQSPFTLHLMPLFQPMHILPLNPWRSLPNKASDSEQKKRAFRVTPVQICARVCGFSPAYQAMPTAPTALQFLESIALFETHCWT
eukprot:scaffold169090_cov14-Tisochrysis_lutea.AAC.1